MTKIGTRSSKRLREAKANGADKGYKITAEDIPGRKVVVDKLSESRKDTIRDCAILAMQNYAIQFKSYREGLRIIKVFKAVTFKEVEGYMYTITFLGECDAYGKTTFKALVFDCMSHRQVRRVWTVTPSQENCCSGTLCVPLISITMDIAFSSDVSPSDLQDVGGDEDNVVSDGTSMSTKEAILRDCAMLAMQDHAIQNDYIDGLHLIKLLKVRSSFAWGYIYSITFRGASDMHGEATYEADVWDGNAERKVGCVRTTGPLDDRWYTGLLSIPKVACQLE